MQTRAMKKMKMVVDLTESDDSENEEVESSEESSDDGCDDSENEEVDSSEAESEAESDESSESETLEEELIEICANRNEIKKQIEALRAECETLLKERKFEEGLKSVEKRIALYNQLSDTPETSQFNFYHCYNDRAICLSKLKKYGEAVEDYKRALKSRALFPVTTPAHVINNSLSGALRALHRYKEARDAEEEAIRLVPDTDVDSKVHYQESYVIITKLLAEQLNDKWRADLKSLYATYIGTYGEDNKRTVDFKKKHSIYL